MKDIRNLYGNVPPVVSTAPAVAPAPAPVTSTFLPDMATIRIYAPARGAVVAKFAAFADGQGDSRPSLATAVAMQQRQQRGRSYGR